MKTITVYGPGCAKCKATEQVINRIVKEVGGASVEKVTDMQAIVQAGVMSTPAVAVDGVIKLAGRVPHADEVKQWMLE